MVATKKEDASFISNKNVTNQQWKTKQEAPSLIARYTCASILIAILGVWGKLTFVDEATAPGVGSDMHSYKIPMFLTIFYLISLPILKQITALFGSVDMKLLLKESMVIYNAAQVVLNGWMVYRFIYAVAFNGHPFVVIFTPSDQVQLLQCGFTTVTNTWSFLTLISWYFGEEWTRFHFFTFTIIPQLHGLGG